MTDPPAHATNAIRVVVAGEHRGLCDALAASLRRRGGLQAIPAGPDPQLASTIGAAHPDVAVVATTGSIRHSVALCAELKGRALVPRAVVVGPGADHTALLEAVSAGADGYVGVDETLDDLGATIVSVHRGEARIPPGTLGALLAGLIHDRRERDAARAVFATLSEREQAVLALLAEGLHPREIAERLYVSPNTVRTHCQNVFAKLQVHSRLEAVSFVLDHDLLPAAADGAGSSGPAGRRADA